MELENMDCMTIEELKEYHQILRLAVRYSRYKIDAMNFRQLGMIPQAMNCEDSCDGIYKQMKQIHDNLGW